MRLRAVFLTFLILPGFCSPLRADDCKVRGYDGTEIVKLECEPVDTVPPSPLRVALPDGSIRGLKLVDPKISGAENPDASKFRVSYNDAATGAAMIKAIGKILPGIKSCEELQMIGYHPAYPVNGNYILATEIDCSATNPANPAYANSLWQKGYDVYYGGLGFDGKAGGGDDSIPALNAANLEAKGFNPIGKNLGSLAFNGTFNGKNKNVMHLTINRAGKDYLGLFGTANGATIMDVRLVDVSVSGGTRLGGLVGASFGGTITNSSSSSGTVTGGPQSSFIGGLIGISGGTITNSSSSGTVTGGPQSSFIGGLAGSSATITNSSSSGTVTGGLNSVVIGGLTGWGHGPITNSYSTGTITGDTNSYVGGLVGRGQGPITNSYSAKSITLGTNSYYIGGLVGQSEGTITNSYSAGDVVCGMSCQYVGGLIGLNSGSLTNSWWFNGMNANGIGSPADGSIMKAGAPGDFYGTGSGKGGAVYGSWDFTNTWRSDPNGPPRLKWES